MKAWVAGLMVDARHPNWAVAWVVGEDVTGVDGAVVLGGSLVVVVVGTDVVVVGADVVVSGTVVEVVAGWPVRVP